MLFVAIMQSYNKLGLRRHACLVAGVFSAVMLAGCAVVEIPLGDGETDNPAVDPLITSSVTETGATDVDPADWKTVQDKISMSFSTLEAGSPTEWTNENTGSNGSIVPAPIVTSERGEVCRPFQTTLDSVSGLENFNGYACRQRNGSWRITKIAPANPLDVPATEAAPAPAPAAGG